MKLIECAQNSPEWLAARLGLPTASVFGTVMAKGRGGGESMTRADLVGRLVLERITKQSQPSYENFLTRRGHEREPGARLAYEVATGRIVTQVGFVRHDRLATGCSPDGLVHDPKHGPGGLEIKSPAYNAHSWALLHERVPPVYVPQVQGGMWICDRRWWDFVSWNPDFPEGGQLVIVRAFRDQAYIDRMAAEVELFLGEVQDEEVALQKVITARRARDSQPMLAAA